MKMGAYFVFVMDLMRKEKMQCGRFYIGRRCVLAIFVILRPILILLKEI